MKKLMLFMLISIGLVGCMHSKDGKIVRDSEGNYYELVGEGALGNKRYQLKLIDTSKYVPVNFK